MDVSEIALLCLAGTLICAVRGSGRSAKSDREIRDFTHPLYENLDSIREIYSPAAHCVFGSAIETVTAAANDHAYPTDNPLRCANMFEDSTKAEDSPSYQAAFAALQQDLEMSETGSLVGPLWSNVTVPESIARRHADLIEHFEQNEDWDFWLRWYHGMWEGTFEDWDLAYEVASIKNEVWEGEDALAKVAARIREIEAELVSKRLPQAERMVLSAGGKFAIKPVEIAKPDLLGATLDQLQDALDDTLLDESNGLQETSREVRVLRRVVQKYGNNPQQIEMGCVSAHLGITRQLTSGDLPPSEENLALQTALEDVAVSIRATDPDVAENRKILTQQRFAELPEAAKETLKEAVPILIAISDEDLADDWNHDIPAVINTSVGPLPTGAPPLPGMDEATRVFSRAAKISILMRASKVVHAIDGSAGYKAARIITTIAALVTIGLALAALI